MFGLNLNGGHLVAASILPVNTTSSDFSYSAWIKINSKQSGASVRLFDSGNGQPRDNVFVDVADGKSNGNPRFVIWNGAASNTAKVVSATKPIEVGVWTFITVTLEGTTGRIYLNGNLVGQGTLDVPSRVDRKLNYIGRSNWSNDPISNVIFSTTLTHSRALTSDEAKLLMTYI